MTTTKQHTPEPWEYGQSGDPQGFSHGVVIRPRGEFPNGRWIADVGSAFNDECWANARRIVACVHACAGIPTTALESGEVERLRTENARLREENARLHGGER